MTTPPDPAFKHHLPIRIYYEDTDAGGVVYNANYLKFAERGRTEYLRALGHNQTDILQTYNIFLAVRHVEVDYRTTAKLDDLLEMETEIVAIGNTSMNVHQILRRGATLVAAIKTTIVAISPAGRATRIPPQLRQILGR